MVRMPFHEPFERTAIWEKWLITEQKAANVASPWPCYICFCFQVRIKIELRILQYP